MQATFEKEMVTEQEAPLDQNSSWTEFPTVSCLNHNNSKYITELQMTADKFTRKLPNVLLEYQ